MSRRGLPESEAASPAEAVVAADQRSGTTGPGEGPSRPSPSAAPERAKLTVQLPRDVIEELRDAVVYLPSQGVQATVAGLVEQAVRRELALLRDDYRAGEPFPTRDTQPRVGRPVGS